MIEGEDLYSSASFFYLLLEVDFEHFALLKLAILEILVRNRMLAGFS